MYVYYNISMCIWENKFSKVIASSMFFPYLDIFWHMAFTGGSDESNSCYRFMAGAVDSAASSELH